MASKFCLRNFAITNVASWNLQFTLGQGESRSCRDRKYPFPCSLMTDILCSPRLGATRRELVLNGKGRGKALGRCTKILQNRMQIWDGGVAGMLDLTMQNIKRRVKFWRVQVGYVFPWQQSSGSSWNYIDQLIHSNFFKTLNVFCLGSRESSTVS